MNEYIFYTTEGHTEAPYDNGVCVENCQVLGRVTVATARQARAILLQENPWITDAGFDVDAAFVRQLLTDAQRQDIAALLHHCETAGIGQDKASPIADIMQRIKQMVE